MEHKRSGDIHRINYLMFEMESFYHQAALKLGISDSVSIVLYTLYDAGTDCLLSDIYKKTGISKQTVNSAIRTLESSGIVYLEPYMGRSKKVILTEKGKEYIQKTAAKIYLAEIQAFDTWSDDEISMYIKLMEKYANCFRQQVEMM